MTYSADLDAYFRRIGYAGSREPTLEALQAISLAHVKAIPFEALDVLLGRGVNLDPAVVERKLVHDGRGGYCFEQNSLMLHVLLGMGYDARPISARVRVSRPRDFLPPRTHVFVRVELGGVSWLVDVGVGALSLTSAIRLDEDGTQETAHEPRRLVREGHWHDRRARGPDARIFHQAFFQSTQDAGQWHDVCEFTLEEMPEIDRELGNWFTSAHPRSHFKDRLIVARATDEGRMTLVNRELTRRDRGGVGVTQVIVSPDELLAVLASEFSLVFPEGTRFPCSGLDWPS